MTNILLLLCDKRIILDPRRFYEIKNSGKRRDISSFITIFRHGVLT